MDVLRHDGDALRVDGAEVGVLEQPNEVGLACLLQSQHGTALEAKVRHEILCDLLYQTLERQLAKQKFRGLLVPADFPQRDGAGAVAMRLLNTSRGGRRLLGSILLQSRPRLLSTG